MRTKPRDDGKETYFFRRIRQIARVHLKIFYNNLIKIRSLPDTQQNKNQISKILNPKPRIGLNLQTLYFMRTPNFAGKREEASD